ncbi:nitrate- and nitrite sensing domain-containing protein [Saccharopolyspora sp. CA-218241]|uniref:sensor histidine kinase n=1 Tax=Saccharopolyspora sp. CA-218241 TaxID=3240027 RepID=UPI003D953673
MSSGLDNSPASAIREDAQEHAAPTWRERITKWRNWKLPVKLTAVVLVPVVFALALGVVQIRDQILRADEYREIEHIVAAAGAVRTSIVELQRERSQAAEYLTAPRFLTDEPDRYHRASERAVRTARSALDAVPASEAVRFARNDAERLLDELADLRRDVLGTDVDPDVVTSSYTEVIGVLMALDRTLISQISSAELVARATTAHELAKISEEIQLQQALVLTGLNNRHFSSDTLAKLSASEARRTAAVKEFRASASADLRNRYDRLYAEPDVPARESAVQLAMAERGEEPSGTSSPLFSPSGWKEQSRTALAAIGALQAAVDQRILHTAFTLQDAASDLAGVDSVILLSALLIASAVVILVTRQLVASLDLLRRSALDAATHQLPRAVTDIRAGRRRPTMIRRVPVETTDEIGDVAQAFDAVQTQAVNLASEQAELRRAYSDSFVNVSRRSQSLLERQLRLFEQLERDEEDPDQLETLFQLDHLATRMRRNNENLMVLSGTDPARRFVHPTSPADLIRAAVSEIEEYPRVVVHRVPAVGVVGYAASDVVRLLAELIDNAAQYSAPTTQVVVSGFELDDGAIVIEIVDQGIGMSTAELTAANQRLASDGEIDPSTSRRMGLFVVGRLATRHRIGVHLQAGADDTGVHATVQLPADLLVSLPPLAAMTNGLPALPGAPDPAERTLVHQFDWAAAERDAEPGMRNGFHLFRPEHDSPAGDAPASIPLQRPEHDDDTVVIDALSSAWFRSLPNQPPQPRWPSGGDGCDSRGTFLSDVAGRFPSSPPPKGESWHFTADLEQRRAEQVANAEPADYTPAGLPVRIPQAHLVAGSVHNARPEPPPQPPRDPAVARDRFASFQEGLRRGRHRQGGEHTSNEGGGDQPEADHSLPEHTESGLPRRTPQSRSAASSSTDAPDHSRRDADLLRGRLNSFQRGAREGKHSLRPNGEQPNQ